MEELPFDFGMWRSKTGANCPIHGEQFGGLAIVVNVPNHPEILRKYCSLCLVDALDRSCTQIVNKE